jgi:hypothetical protein
MAETLTGQVRNGVVVFDAGFAPPPEGTRVRIEPASEELAPGRTPLLELLDRLEGMESEASDWPEDAAAQHDHYLYGAPKRP